MIKIDMFLWKNLWKLKNDFIYIKKWLCVLGFDYKDILKGEYLKKEFW